MGTKAIVGRTKKDALITKLQENYTNNLINQNKNENKYPSTPPPSESDEEPDYSGLPGYNDDLQTRLNELKETKSEVNPKIKQEKEIGTQHDAGPPPGLVVQKPTTVISPKIPQPFTQTIIRHQDTNYPFRQPMEIMPNIPIIIDRSISPRPNSDMELDDFSQDYFSSQDQVASRLRRYMDLSSLPMQIDYPANEIEKRKRIQDMAEKALLKKQKQSSNSMVLKQKPTITSSNPIITFPPSPIIAPKEVSRLEGITRQPLRITTGATIDYYAPRSAPASTNARSPSTVSTNSFPSTVSISSSHSPSTVSLGRSSQSTVSLGRSSRSGSTVSLGRSSRSGSTVSINSSNASRASSGTVSTTSTVSVPPSPTGPAGRAGTRVPRRNYRES